MNVDDALRENLLEAYQAQYPGLDATHSLTEQWQEMIDRGPESMDGFMNGLKGKIAEFDARDQLQGAGWSDVEIAQDPTQAVWDIRAVSPEGTLEYWQVKNVGVDQAGGIQQLMVENPDVNFALNSEVYGRVAESAPELADQMMDTGPMVEIDGMGRWAHHPERQPGDRYTGRGVGYHPLRRGNRGRRPADPQRHPDRADLQGG